MTVPTATKKKGRILTIVHSRRSSPGRTEEILARLGYEMDRRCLPAGDTLPDHLDDHVGTIIFGGPMSAYHTHKPYIRTELEWIPRALNAGKPFLGICLGGQLLSKALGAPVEPHPEGLTEIGYGTVRPTEEGRDLFDGELRVYQWHGDTMGLPAGGVRLATSDLFDTQAYRLGSRVFALQFHPEVTREMVIYWTRAARPQLVRPGAQPRPQQLADCARYDGRVAIWFEAFLRRWLDDDTPGRPNG
jgi:GMP synthase (glutamine-hydrolysing)